MLITHAPQDLEELMFKLSSLGFCTLVFTVCGLQAHAQNPLDFSTSEQFIGPSGELSDEFGTSIAIDGDTAVISAPDEDGPSGNSGGAVYVLERTPGVGWSIVSRIEPLVPTSSSAGFGSAVALNGDWLAVGARFAARTYMFQRSGNSWIERQVIVAPPPFIFSTWFGSSISISGGRMAIGAPETNFSGVTVQIFRFNGTQWDLDGNLSPNHGDAFHGGSVVLRGTRLFVGAPDYTQQGEGGAVFVYRRGINTWDQESVILPPPGNSSIPMGGSSNDFGTSVAVRNGLMVVGHPSAPLFDSSGSLLTFSGRALVYREVLGTWTLVDELRPRLDLMGSAGFGHSVSLTGSVLAVGAPFESEQQFRQGAAYCYVRNGSSFSDRKRVTFAAPGNNDWFGWSVAADEAFLFAGARNQTSSIAPTGKALIRGLVATSLDLTNVSSQCFGEDANGVTCAKCPCDNASSHAFFRGGCVNSVGGTATLFALTDPVPGELEMALKGGPPGVVAVLASGSTAPARPGCPTGSGLGGTLLDGLRCISGEVFRHHTRGLDETGSSSGAWDTLESPTGPFLPGQTRVFQVIMRDSIADSCGSGLATSNALLVTFQP